MTEPHYHINLFWSDEDNLWIADVPDLRGCMTHGDTRADAVRNAAEAIEGWIETARDQGFSIPEPKYRPAIYAARDAAGTSGRAPDSRRSGQRNPAGSRELGYRDPLGSSA